MPEKAGVGFVARTSVKVPTDAEMSKMELAVSLMGIQLNDPTEGSITKDETKKPNKRKKGLKSLKRIIDVDE